MPAVVAEVDSPWKRCTGGVTAPRGYQAGGISAGLKASGRPDLAVVVAPEAAVCAGCFTTSCVRAACVDLCSERLQNTSGQARAVLINSGQANACTGDRGLIDSLRATEALADRLGLDAGISWSCYDPTPDGKHCGLCDSCRLRSKGYQEAGLPDPTIYAVQPPKA